MQNEWLIDVLTDLRRFSEEKGMPATASALEDVCLIALAELEANRAAGMGPNAEHEGKAGESCRQFADSDVA